MTSPAWAPSSADIPAVAAWRPSDAASRAAASREVCRADATFASTFSDSTWVRWVSSEDAASRCAELAREIATKVVTARATTTGIKISASILLRRDPSFGTALLLGLLASKGSGERAKALRHGQVTYIASISAAYLASIGRRLSFIVGVS